MTLADQLFYMMQKNQDAMQLTDMLTGTVTSVTPLEITVSTEMAPLRREVLILTESVTEKTVVIDGYSVTLNRSLAVDDKVILLRVLHGQKFIVLSRIYETGASS